MSLEPRQVTGVKAVQTGSLADVQAMRRGAISGRVANGLPLIAGGSGPITIIAAAAHQVPQQYWEAGRTPAPPTAPVYSGSTLVTPSNTIGVDANDPGVGEYWYTNDGSSGFTSLQGCEEGHGWPYMSPGALVEYQNPAAPGVSTGRFFPANIINQGINHYQRGFPFRKWMFGRRAGRFHIVCGGGVVAADSVNPTRPHCIEFALCPNLSLKWNNGDGGGTTAGMLPTPRTFGFRTPDFTFNDLEQDGSGGSGLFTLELWGFSVYRGISFWVAEMTLSKNTSGEGGFSDPIWSTRRTFFYSNSAINFDTLDGNMAFLFKVDGKSPTTQEVTYSGRTGTFSVGQDVTKGGISGTIISHSADGTDGIMLIGRISNASFGSSGTITGPTGSATIVSSTNEYQPFGRVNNAAWSAAPAAGKWPPNVPQDGTAATFQADFFHVDFYPGL